MFEVFFIMMRMALTAENRWDEDTQRLMMKILVVIFGDMDAGKRGIYARDCQVISQVIKRVSPNRVSGYNSYNKLFKAFLLRNPDIYADMSMEADDCGILMVQEFIRDFYPIECIPDVCLKVLEHIRSAREKGKIRLDVAVHRFNEFFYVSNNLECKYNKEQNAKIRMMIAYRKKLLDDLEIFRMEEKKRQESRRTIFEYDGDDWIGDWDNDC